MEKILSFQVFCLENYKTAHNLTGKDAHDIFTKYGIFKYITDFYDILHSFGPQYLINDIDEYIKNREK